MPIGDVLVGDARCDIKHDDAALSVDVIAISETTKLFLPRSIPDVELDGSQVLYQISQQRLLEIAVIVLW